ncbi:MAG: hypothetical protein ACRCZD_04320, partial [Phycicoccus sp.]
IDGVGVTQSKTLAAAEQAARDYIGSIYDLSVESDVEVVVTPRLGPVGAMVTSAKAKRRKADEANTQAAAAVRAVAARLISSGLSTADAATVLGVSKGRVSQLTNTQVPTAKRAPAKTSAAASVGKTLRRQPAARVAAKSTRSGRSVTRSSTLPASDTASKRALTSQ